jgi:lytic murein transglycosylase
MTKWRKRLAWLCTAMLAGASMAGPAAAAAACQKDMPFDRWLDGVTKEAAAEGVSQAAITSARPAMTFDPAIVRRDRGQGVFQQSFLQFSDRMASGDRMQRGARLIQANAALFGKIERQYGVPAPVLAAFWGLESDFGTNNGKFPILRAVTTLAYDCRRPDFFRRQLIDALRIIQRGDLTASEMIGDWAGELGAMQFTPSDYFKYAVDYDGDGRRDLIRSVPDTLASAANFLANLGWQKGQPWLQEVRVSANVPWDQADLEIQHPRSQWVSWGVTAAHGGSLPADDLKASLLLPMGRFGPAFLAYPSFKAFLGWNSAMVYSTTAAYLATRIAGAPPVGRGSGNVPILTPQQVADLQRLLAAQRFGGGEIDGKLGSATRAAVKKAQMKLGLPADSYPTAELIERLRVAR